MTDIRSGSTARFRGAARFAPRIANRFAKLAGASALSAALGACLAGCGNGSVPAPTPLGISALSGNYVFLATGTDANDGDYSVVGSFVADGKGNITSGVADYNLGSGVDYNVPLTGTYTASSGAASITLTDGGSVTDTFTATLATKGETTLTNFDGSGSGFLFPQVTSGFALAGTYSFSLSGEEDGVLTGSGQLVASSSGTFTSGSLTASDGATSGNFSPVTGLLSPPAANGRGFANIEGNNLAYYVIGPNQVQFMGIDSRLLVTALAQKM